MKKVLFHSNQFGLRGTETALYDMAYYNETILGNISYVASPKNSEGASLEKFKERFSGRVLRYSYFHILIDLCWENEISHIYWIKGGDNDRRLVEGKHNFVHCVFNCDQPHGEVYAPVSEWLGDKYNRIHLSHIVSLPDVKEDYREVLGIPKEALVVGRHGGYDQLSVEYVQDAIHSAIDLRPDIYFLLMNTKPFNFHNDRIIYIDPTYDLEEKTAFINTCDVGLTGRTDGESFGLAIAEYLHQNKPVITNIDGRDRNHLRMLKDKGFYYSNVNELFSILINFKKREYNVKYLVDDFKPEKIMNQFNNIFLSKEWN